MEPTAYCILVVDNETDIEALILQKFRSEIRQGKYEFEFAHDGFEAYQKVLDMPKIGMVLTDINMLVMDGLTLLKKLNALEQPPKTVVVSAYNEMDNIRTAMNWGAFDFLTKPINFEDLAITLERTLKAVAEMHATQERIKQAQVQLIQNEKMSSLGQLIAGVAHEISNPVNFIHGNLIPAKNNVQDLMILLDLYQNHYPQPRPEIQDYIEEIDLNFLQKDLLKLLNSLEIGASRIRELVLSLRNFSRLDEATKKAVDIHEGIDSTLLILNNRLKATSSRPEIQVVREYGMLPLIECYPNQLNQVIMNILVNAIDALEERSQSQSFQSLEKNHNIIRIITDMNDNYWTSVTIADNGPGIGEESISKLFEHFFTTKPIGKGTGLGLAISYQIIVERHGGELLCDSEPGKGTRFIIKLPHC